MAAQIDSTPIVKGEAALKIYNEANKKGTEASKKGVEKLRKEFKEIFN